MLPGQMGKICDKIPSGPADDRMLLTGLDGMFFPDLDRYRAGAPGEMGPTLREMFNCKICFGDES